MALEEAAVRQALDDGFDFRTADDEPAVRPRRHPVKRVRQRGRLEDEQADDPLRPCRAGLERRRNDDVVGPRNDLVPPRRIEVVTPVDARALGQGDCHAGPALLVG